MTGDGFCEEESRFSLKGLWHHEPEAGTTPMSEWTVILKKEGRKLGEGREELEGGAGVNRIKLFCMHV